MRPAHSAIAVPVRVIVGPDDTQARLERWVSWCVDLRVRLTASEANVARLQEQLRISAARIAELPEGGGAHGDGIVIAEVPGLSWPGGAPGPTLGQPGDEEADRDCHGQERTA